MGEIAEIPRDFQQRMARLVGLRFPPASLQTHWEALRELAVEDLDNAISRAAKECGEYPTPNILRSFASQMATRIGLDEDRSVPLEVPTVVRFPAGGVEVEITRAWKFYCDKCEDTGWVGQKCAANGRCGRERCHYAHDYVGRCECWHYNAALVRKRQGLAQRAHTRMSKGRES